MPPRVHIIEAPDKPDHVIVASDDDIREGRLPEPLPMSEQQSIQEAARNLMEKLGGGGKKPSSGNGTPGKGQGQGKQKQKTPEERQQDTDNLFKLFAKGTEPVLSHITEAQRNACEKAPAPDEATNAILEVMKPVLGELLSQQPTKPEPKVDKDEVKRIVDDIISTSGFLPTRDIVVTTEDKVVTIKERQHYLFPLLLKIVGLRLHPYLVGPAGSGKTQVAESTAKALGLPFYAISVCSQSTEYQLKGYYNATGGYVRSLFREAFEKGGVFLIDEIDAGNPNIVACLNSALSNEVCAFPDGMVKKHKDFVCVAAANTYGTGASREYVGRNPLDAATLDRFVFLDFCYDPGLEAHMVGLEGVPSPNFELEEGGLCKTEQWLKKIEKSRKGIKELGVRTVISPRATLFGTKLTKAGVGVKHLERMLIYKGMEETTRLKLANLLAR